MTSTLGKRDCKLLVLLMAMLIALGSWLALVPGTVLSPQLALAEAGDPEVHIELTPEGRRGVYSDGTLDLKVTTQDLPAGSQFIIAVGIWDEEKRDYDPLYEEGADKAYTKTALDAEGACTVTLNGQWLWENVPETDDGRKGVAVEAAVLSAESTWITSDHVYVAVNEARIDPNGYEDTDMVPGASFVLNKRQNCYMENTAHPFGDDMPYYLRNVKVENDDPVGEVVSVSPTQDEDGFVMEAKSVGKATIRLEYGFDEQSDVVDGSYTFGVTVAPVALDVNAWVDGTWMALPGQSVKVMADGKIATQTDSGPEYSKPGDDCTWEWSLVGNPEEIASIQQDPEDPKRATVTFKPYEGQDPYEHRIVAQVTLSDGKGNSKSTMTATFVSSSFMQVWPVELEKMPGLNETFEIKPELRVYENGSEGYQVKENAQFVADFDHGSLESVSTPQEQEQRIFKFKRLTMNGTDLRIRALLQNDQQEMDEVARTDYWLRELRYDISFEDPNKNELYVTTDGGARTGTLEVKIDTTQLAELEGWQLNAHLVPENEPGVFYDDALTIDQQNSKITIDGSKIPQEKKAVYLHVFAAIGETRLAETDMLVTIKDAVEHYFEEPDTNALVGHRIYVRKTNRVYVENAEHPGGEEFTYQVTGAEIASQEPQEAGKPVVVVRDEYDKGRYVAAFTAANYGKAELKVTCQTLAGEPWDYTFWVTVAPDYYDGWVDAVGTDTTLLGGTLTLQATGIHRFDSKDEQFDGFTFDWHLSDGSDAYVSSFEVDPEDSSKATLTFKSAEELGPNVSDCAVDVWADVLDNDETCFTTERIQLYACSAYDELWPLDFEGSDKNVELSSTAEVRHYELGSEQEYTVIPNVEFSWNFDDKNVNLVSSTEDNGTGAKNNKVTITRLLPWGTDVNVEARWLREDESEASLSRTYALAELSHRVWFEEEDGKPVAYPPNCAASLTVNTTEVAPFGGGVAIEVGKPREGAGKFEWEVQLDESEFTVVKEEGRMLVKVPAESLAKHGIENSAIVYAVYYIDGEAFWVDQRSLTLDDTLTHALVEEKVDSSKVTSNWRCVHCGKLFADKDATKQICAMYRLYNPNSGEHFYTASEKERDDVTAAGWAYEGIGWFAPADDTSKPVYRVYNSVGGEHHYTMDASERDNLVAHGWNDEGIGWYSDPAQSVGLTREYNPNQFACNHNYTTDPDEHAMLLSYGWKDEGIAWYAVKAGK